MKPDQAKAQARSHRAQAIVLALESLDAVERVAQALQADAARGRSCSPSAMRRHRRPARRLSKDGIVDDYVQHFPAPADPDRLATSVRLAARIAPPATRHGGADARRAAAAPARSAARSSSSSRTTRCCTRSSRRCSNRSRVDLVFETDGAAAFDRVNAVGPDLVLMDVMLPGGDGVALTERIKSTPDLAAIPVVMLSGEARLDTLVRSMEAGAADFIVKPFTREALIAKLGKYLPAAA